jgi:glycosyltransferase involved in cell wall biosynthesis
MKKKILLLCDDLRLVSGVATMAKEIVYGTVHKYDWVQLGAAIKNPDYGKIVDLNEEVRKETGVPDANVKIIPNNDYGNIFLLRNLIKEEKPDAILHFTDPHFWEWLYNNENEIRQQIPILFYHVWDSLPNPQYNRNYYESCDWIGCISRQTYGIVNNVGKRTDFKTFKPLEDWQIDYVPHGVNPNVFKPLEEINKDIRKTVFNGSEFDFVIFYNSRNIRRKQPSDIIYSFKLFCDQLPKERADRCLLLMRTESVDENGTDLVRVSEDLAPNCKIHFLDVRISQSELNELYNIADCTVNISNNEGFGISTIESLMAGTPIIVNVTGGLQDQCGFNIDGKEFTEKDYIDIGSLHNKEKWSHIDHGNWCIPIWSVSQTINGSPMTPYIFEDRINHDDVSDTFMQMYLLGRDRRKKMGLEGRDWVMKNFSSSVMCEKMINGIETAFNKFKKKEKYRLYKII